MLGPFLAALLCRSARPGWSASWPCAGHPRPLLIGGGTVTEVGRWGMTLGVTDATFAAQRATVRVGELLVLYTDGVLDARDGARFFGEQRLRETVRDARSADDAVGRVTAALDARPARRPTTPRWWRSSASRLLRPSRGARDPPAASR